MTWSDLLELYGDDYFESLFMKDLGRDESYLRITNNGNEIPVYLLQSHRDCVECDYYKKGSIYGNEVWKIHSAYKYRISKTEYDNPTSILCNLTEPTGEFGVYNMTFDDKSCIIETVKDPVNIYLPMLTVLLIYMALVILVFGIMKLQSVLQKTGNIDVANEESSKSAVRKARVKSLDVFRGISITVMIFVNLGAGGYNILDHTPWNGLHLADFVFPCFLWIMGACIPISLISSFKKGVSNQTLILAITIRSIKLFLLGVFLNSGIYLDKFRLMGVLQRFGVSYFVVTVICILLLNRSTLLNDENRLPNVFTSYITTMLAWIPILIMAVLHLLIIFLVADGTCEKGYLGPGGLHKHGKYQNCSGGAAGFLDRAILKDHVFRFPTCLEVYQSQSFDPEGLLGCLNSIVHTFIGVQAGIILLIHKDHMSRILHWITWAFFMGVVGGGLCGFSQENGWIPINKNLWSLSYIFVTSCTAFVLLVLCYALIDMKKWWGGQPLVYAGMNSILMYLGHQITTGFFPFSWKINDYDTQTHFLFLLENVTATAIWLWISYYLYTIKFFLTI